MAGEGARYYDIRVAFPKWRQNARAAQAAADILGARSELQLRAKGGGIPAPAILEARVAARPARDSWASEKEKPIWQRRALIFPSFWPRRCAIR